MAETEGKIASPRGMREKKEKRKKKSEKIKENRGEASGSVAYNEST